MGELEQVQITFPEATGRQSLTLSRGQRFVATVRRSPHGLILEFGEHRLPARAEMNVTDGDRLLFEVTDVRNELVLRRVDHFGQHPALQQALRHAVPRQGSAPLLAAAINACEQATEEVPSSFINALPSLTSLGQAGNFGSMFTNCGLFCEHRIATSNNPEQLRADLKVQLLRWMRWMAPQQPSCTATLSQPSAISSSAAAFLQRLTALQVRMALYQQEDDWTLEIPFRDDAGLGSARLRIRRTHDSSAPPGERALTLDANLQLYAAAPMYVVLFLRGKSIDCAWWSTCASTVQALREAVAQLRQRLIEQGFAQPRINIQHGWPNLDQTAPSSEIPPGMIYEQV